MNLIFRPIGIIAGLLAGALSRRLFDLLWGRIDDQEAPQPKHRRIQWPKMIVALLIEGAVFRLVRGLIDRGVRRLFSKTTGTWPGEEAPGPA